MYCKLVESLNPCLSLQLLPFILMFPVDAKLGMAWHGVGFMARLLNNVFTNRIDHFTNEDGVRTTEFESIFTIH